MFCCGFADLKVCRGVLVSTVMPTSLMITLIRSMWGFIQREGGVWGTVNDYLHYFHVKVLITTTSIEWSLKQSENKLVSYLFEVWIFGGLFALSNNPN